MQRERDGENGQMSGLMNDAVEKSTWLKTATGPAGPVEKKDEKKSEEN